MQIGKHLCRHDSGQLTHRFEFHDNLIFHQEIDTLPLDHVALVDDIDHNLALNSLHAFSLPGDISASDRYWDEDIIDPPVVMKDGVIELSDKPGMGYEVVEERVKNLKTAEVESNG